MAGMSPKEKACWPVFMEPVLEIPGVVVYGFVMPGVARLPAFVLLPGIIGLGPESRMV